MQSDLDIVLTYEDPAEYRILRADLVADYQPANTREILLVDQVARAYWRLRRAEHIETCALDDRLESLARENGSEDRDNLDAASSLAAVYMTEPEKRFKHVAQQLRDAQQAWYRAIREIELVQARRFRRERAESKKPKSSAGLPSSEPPSAALQPARSPAPLHVPRTHPPAAAPNRTFSDHVAQGTTYRRIEAPHTRLSTQPALHPPRSRLL
jgi:hypothetical protein